MPTWVAPTWPIELVNLGFDWPDNFRKQIFWKPNKSFKIQNKIKESKLAFILGLIHCMLTRRSVFLATQIYFLGFVVSSNRVSADPEKVSNWGMAGTKGHMWGEKFSQTCYLLPTVYKRVQHCYAPYYGLSKERWVCMV